MKVIIKTIDGSRTIEDIRYKIKYCADTIIENIEIMQYVYDEFGHDLDVHDAERLSNIVYEQIKLRM